MQTFLYLLFAYWLIGIVVIYFFWFVGERDTLKSFNWKQHLAANIVFVFLFAPVFPLVAIKRHNNVRIYKKLMGDQPLN